MCKIIEEVIYMKHIYSKNDFANHDVENNKELRV